MGGVGEHNARCLFGNGVRYGEVAARRQIAPRGHMRPLTSVSDPVYDIMLAVSR